MAEYKSIFGRTSQLTLNTSDAAFQNARTIGQQIHALEAIYFAGGRAVPEGAGYAYQYIIRDHLGNSRVMFKDTVGGPKIVQENHYYPFGMNMDGVFIGSNHKYQYNGKELHDDLGYNQYDYGARWYDPSVGRFMGVDPLAHEYANISPYAYVGNNPINAIDPDGARILFVNGYCNRWIGGLIGSGSPGKNYWGSGFTEAAQKFFNDNSGVDDMNYIDGSSLYGGDSSGGGRKKHGYSYAKKNYKSLIDGLGKDETFKLVTHSEGGAYGAGIAEYLMEMGHKVETILNLSTDEADEFSTPENTDTYQLDYNGDWVTGNKGSVKGTDLFGVVDKFASKSDQRKYAHGSTKSAGVFNEVKALLQSAATNAIGIKVNTTENGVKFTFIRDNRND